MRTDAMIRRDVECELQWDPRVDDRKIDVVVDNGVVTLTGEVSHHPARAGAEHVARNIVGVRAIANDICVRVASPDPHVDHDIACATLQVLRWSLSTHGLPITPIVSEGYVTLTGHVHWEFQKHAAQHAIRRIPGVVGVTNDICTSLFASGSDSTSVAT